MNQIPNSKKIEMLHLLKTDSKKKVSEQTHISVKTIERYCRQYRLNNIDAINRAIERLNQENHPDYLKQQACDHLQAKIFIKCTCSLCLSEETGLAQIIEIAQRKLALQGKKLIEVAL